MGRRDGFEGGLPPMPWKEGLKHEWVYSTMRFGGGNAYEVRCSRCGEEYVDIDWDEEVDRYVSWPEVPEYGCRPDADRPIER